MARKPKNLIQKLTAEDRDLLEIVVTKYKVKYYSLIQQYPNPRKYVEEIVLKQIHSDNAISSLYTILYAINIPSNQVLSPGEINERLANDIRHTIQQDFSDTMDPFHRERFLHPRDLRENVLRNLENDGILLHLEGKKAITNYLNPTIPAGKKPISVSGHDRGGKWSGYTAAEEVKKLKRTMDKPEALDFLCEKTVRSGLAHKLAKFIFMVILHAIKMDEKVVQTLIGFGASFFHSTITEKDTSDFKSIHQKLRTLDDNQLEQFADSIAKSAIEDGKYYTLLFFTGLSKL